MFAEMCRAISRVQSIIPSDTYLAEALNMALALNRGSDGHWSTYVRTHGRRHMHKDDAERNGEVVSEREREREREKERGAS